MSSGSHLLFLVWAIWNTVIGAQAGPSAIVGPVLWLGEPIVGEVLLWDGELLLVAMTCGRVVGYLGLMEKLGVGIENLQQLAESYKVCVCHKPGIILGKTLWHKFLVEGIFDDIIQAPGVEECVIVNEVRCTVHGFVIHIHSLLVHYHGREVLVAQVVIWICVKGGGSHL